MNHRQETDSIGAIEVPAEKYWGAQTQRSLKYFDIGEDRIPIECIRALALIKKAAATANCELGKLSTEKRDLIASAADEIRQGKFDDQFPLRVWMTGSGTQSNMNVNEVISNRAIEQVGGTLGSKDPIHPNDDVNRSQSSNDVFPTAMHIAAAVGVTSQLLPAAEVLRDALQQKAKEWDDIVKIGRTHMQDAVPMTLGQEFSGYAALLGQSYQRIKASLEEVYPLALGGTAIGTGLNAPKGFAEAAIKVIAGETDLPFRPADNLFAAQGSHDGLVALSGQLRTLGGTLYKIANDIRLLSCGPRAGLGELTLPANEPGSSIMPGKVNPTQCEALAMVGAQIMGYDHAVAIGGASGLLEMNVYKPLMIFNIMQSIRLLSDGMTAFTHFCIEGMEPNRSRIDDFVQQSLMLVTALSPKIGYDKASAIAHHAHEHNSTLKEAALGLGHISEADFDKAVDPLRMAKPYS